MSNRYAIAVVRSLGYYPLDMGIFDREKRTILYLEYGNDGSTLDVATKTLEIIAGGDTRGEWESLSPGDDVVIINEMETWVTDPTVGVRTVTGEVVMAHESELKRALESLNEG